MSIKTAQQQLEELQQENERLKADVRNAQQVIYLSRSHCKRLQLKLEKVEKDNTYIEQAFENFVNEVETEKMKAKIAEDMEIARLRNRVRAA